MPRKSEDNAAGRVTRNDAIRATSLAVMAVIATAKLASEIVAPTVVAILFALTLAPLVPAVERGGLSSTLRPVWSSTPAGSASSAAYIC